MSTPGLRLIQPRSATETAPEDRRRLGRILVDQGEISASDLMQGLAQQRGYEAPIGEILVAEGLATETAVLGAVSEQRGVRLTDLDTDPPDPFLYDSIDVGFCLRHRIIPWMKLGNTLLIATSRPDQFQTLRRHLPQRWADALPVLAEEHQIIAHIERLHGGTLAPMAEARVTPLESCRTWTRKLSLQRLALLGLAIGLIAGAVKAPAQTVVWLSIWALATLFIAATLKTCALAAQGFRRSPDGTAPDLEGVKLPRISVLVPLLRETEIANALVRRLSRLTYPKALLDVVLVLEESDQQTQATLARTDLPPWMRVVEVPETNGLTTKPRAMNYALDFCKGDIIGVWDAEDAPAPDQLERVAHHFANADDDVACLQGVLDYYNPKANWLARCFTIEYAMWWRILLPGIAKMGLVIPLGGTTLFFKRPVLESLGRWDAHNVTEDADLGVRLARHGHRTELISTVTHEEANCRPWRWIRQRSRWLKGYMITYMVHMRRPVLLWRQLGTWKFLGLQAFFVTTLSQFVFAPVIWSFLVIPFGISHPAVDYLGPDLALIIAAALFSIEAINLTSGLIATSGREHRHLMKWVPTMMLYFPLAAFASYKALYELIAKPFYWDKTQHGVT
jgi:cellulose synthase/poly-beta-1,6-N-acetylglucosamine synthase-like glycosyltransferase